MLGNVKKNIFLATLVLIFSVNASPPYEEIIEGKALLSDEALFSRCYSHLTGRRASSNHPLLVMVRQGNKNPIDACMEIFDKAMILGSTNKVSDTDDEETLAVLQVFFDYHKSWFTYNDFSQAPQVYGQNLDFQQDSSQEACYLTHALFSGDGVESNGRFQNGYDYKNIVTTPKEVRCLRSEPTRLGVNRYTDANYSSLPEWSNAPGRGFLIGTKEQPAYDNVWFTKNGRAITTLSYVGGGAAQNLDSNVLHTFGGGILGSSAFLIKYGQYPNNADGAAFMRRRATSSIMEHLLCRTAPYRRVEDVTSEVIQFNSSYPNDTVLAFRKDTACMSCHSTQDGMAALYRNLHYVAHQGYVDWNDNGVFGRPAGESNYNRFADGEDKHYMLRTHAINLAKETVPLHMVVTDSNFHRRPPNGQLVYRSYDGTEVNHMINVTGGGAVPAGEGIAKMGEHMSQGNDLFACAAKRYFPVFYRD
jgi:hypothetical protein